MIRNRPHISALFAVLITVGLSYSIGHYHSGGLECLEHASEAHLVQNEVICPVTSLVVSFDFDVYVGFDGFLQSEDFLFISNPEVYSGDYFSPSLGRSPPVIA